MSDYSDIESNSGSDYSDSESRTKRKASPPSSVGVTPKAGNASLQYQKLSQLEHILKRPDTYIGSVEKSEIEMWCYDQETELMVLKKVNIVSGLYKIFDEILVNAADNKIRDPSMKNIKVSIDPTSNTILVFNDGKGIPVEIHDKENIYIPELIFGNLLTSSNYDDDEKKVVGGRNGFGAKLCNIFSSHFEVETADLNSGHNYKQTWSNNMLIVSKPKITKMKNKREYTKITFKPDLAKFNMEVLDEDILSVLRRRVYDLCGTVKDCNVYLNDSKLAVKNFKGYVEMFVKALQNNKGGETEVPSSNYSSFVHEVINERWEVAFAVSDGNFNQVSFVNSIATTAGGTHVKMVSDQIVDKILEDMNKKVKGKSKLMIKANQVKSNIFIFVNCLIENPAFTSQTKEQLTTRVSQFATKQQDKFAITDLFIKKIMKTSIIDTIRSIVDANEGKVLQKEDGRRKSRIKGHVKLVDANKAGTKEGFNCTLILTEGDSALSLAVAGLAVVGRDYYGCFPLRGKLLNVRDASADQIAKNAEITALKKIIGLQHRKQYDPENIKELRYGHVMIMTDQDHDGSHIKGLLINFFESSFPGLLSIPGFLLEFITPIVKVTLKARGNNTQKIPFYSMPEFEKWRDTEGAQCRWSHKYYKGLGTSTPAEAREYFSRLDKHLKEFHALQGEDRGLIDLAFSKKKADERKEWLQGFQPGTHLDSDLSIVPISDFINEELILFSMADNIRSIPSVLDGFKPGQRKVLFGCFKRNLVKEIKVAQLVGYIGEKTGYHHGEQSLTQTVIGLAQNFIGSNNLNLLKPNGGFGTRAAGGKDFSAARYIFTELNEITRCVFNPLDDALYTYVQDDEQTVEPEWYLPVVPMLLVNGSEGIGTGWSTNIPSFNPLDLVDNIRRLMRGEELLELTPWFRGWEGSIEQSEIGKYKIKGEISQIDDKTLEITEIPVKTWTNSVKEFLLDGINNDKNSWIKDMEEQHTSSIRFVIRLTDSEMEKSLKIGLLERFKLVSTMATSNMVAFDPNGRIKKYEDPNEILRDFFYVRLEFYQKRKDFLKADILNQLLKLSEQARFIKLIIDKELTISNKKRLAMVETLIGFNFARFDKSGKQVESVQMFVDEDEEEDQVQNGELDNENVAENEHIPVHSFSQYDYLLGMPLWALTKERFEKLLQQKYQKEEELMILLGKSAKDLWNEDLDVFVEMWRKFLEEDKLERSKLISGPGLKSKKRNRKVKEEDEDYSDNKKRRMKKGNSGEKILGKKSSTESKTSASKASKNPFSKSLIKTEKLPKPLIESSESTPSSDNLPVFFKKSTVVESGRKPAARSKFFDSSDDEEITSQTGAQIGVQREGLNDSISAPKGGSQKNGHISVIEDVEDLSDVASTSSRRKRNKPVVYSIQDGDEDEDEDEDEGSFSDSGYSESS